jgi:hypothetical protein
MDENDHEISTFVPPLFNVHFLYSDKVPKRSGVANATPGDLEV